MKSLPKYNDPDYFYKTQFQGHKLLSEEETLTQIFFVQHGSIKERQTAWDILIKHNYGLIFQIATYYKKKYPRMELSDLLTVGAMGVMRASQSYIEYPKEGKKAKFVTYIYSWINHHIRREVERQSEDISFVNYYKGRQEEIFKACEYLKKKYGKEPTQTEIAKFVGISINSVGYAYNKYKPSYVNIDNVFDSIDKKPKTEALSLEERKKAQYDIDIITEIDTAEKKELLNKALSCLSPKREEIIRRYYGLWKEKGKCETLEEIGNSFGVTRERIRQIKANHNSTKKNKNGYEKDACIKGLRTIIEKIIKKEKITKGSNGRILTRQNSKKREKVLYKTVNKIIYKRCTKCKEWLLLDQFHNDVLSKNKKRQMCKTCSNYNNKLRYVKKEINEKKETIWVKKGIII